MGMSRSPRQSAPRFRVTAIDLLERDVKLRMPFRFGVVTLTAAPQAFARARIRQFAEMINSGIQPLQNLDVTRKFSEDKDAQMRWSQHWIKRGLAACEAFLREHRQPGAKFCFGMVPTLADACLFPQLYSADRNEVDLGAYPILNAVLEQARGTPEYQATHPDSYKPD